MSRWQLTERAQADLDAVWDFAAQEDALAANRLVDSLVEAVRRLAVFPGMGRERDDLGPRPVRLWTARGFVILYRHIPDDALVLVLRILHGSRDLGAALTDDETPPS